MSINLSNESPASSCHPSPAPNQPGSPAYVPSSPTPSVQELTPEEALVAAHVVEEAEANQPLFVRILNRPVGEPSPSSPRTIQTAISLAGPNEFSPSARAVIQSLIDTISHRTDIAQGQLDERATRIDQLQRTIQ
jgi:hypothetical protein